MNSVLLLILFPLISAVLVFFAGRKSAGKIALTASVLSLFIFLYQMSSYHPHKGVTGSFMFNWIPGINAEFHMGLDSQSLILMLLTSLVVPIGITASLPKAEEKGATYYGLMLIGLSALLGFFAAQNAITFYVFFEAALIPFYLIVLMHGGPERKKAVFKFFIYTVFGSLLMLGAIIYFYSLIGINKAGDWSTIYLIDLPLDAQMWILGGLFVAFAIKSPLFPFHTWQADLYAQADRPTVILIAAILSKMGVFGMLRFYNVVPEAIDSMRYALICLCLIGVIYGALVAWRQSEMTRIVAYSSLSHMGMIAAALFSGTVSGLEGSLFQMFTHGILAAGLFFVIDVLMQRSNNPSIYGYTGLAKSQPRLAVYFFVIVLASVGLPLTNGFIGELYMLWGITEYNLWLGAIAGVSIILGAVYMLRFFQKSMMGESLQENSSFAPLKIQEDYIFIVMMFIILSFGFFPKTWLELSEYAVAQFAHFKI
jgi:NADH-quinone oxidoreductase subunit M